MENRLVTKEIEEECRISPMMLINEINRLMGDKIREGGDDNPISQRSGRLLLMELSKKDGVTQLELVNATHLKAPTISVSLGKLEQNGYVYRRPDEYDLRATRVFLTEKGKELDSKIKKRIRTEERLATEKLTKEECEMLSAILIKIRNNIIKKMEDREY